MSEMQTAHPSIPFLKTHEEQASKIRRQLEGVFRELRLIHDVITICAGVCEAIRTDYDKETEHVLRRCGADRLYSVLKTLTEMVERFGGTTDLSADRSDKHRPPDARNDS